MEQGVGYKDEQDVISAFKERSQRVPGESTTYTAPQRDRQGIMCSTKAFCGSVSWGKKADTMLRSNSEGFPRLTKWLSLIFH